MQKIKSIKKICLILSSILGLSAAETVDNFSGLYLGVGATSVLNSTESFKGNLTASVQGPFLGLERDVRSCPALYKSTTRSFLLFNFSGGYGAVCNKIYTGIELNIDTNFNKKVKSKANKLSVDNHDLTNEFNKASSGSNTYYTDYGLNLRLGYVAQPQILLYVQGGLSSDFQSIDKAKERFVKAKERFVSYKLFDRPLVWSFGLGAQYALTPNHHLRLDYRHCYGKNKASHSEELDNGVTLTFRGHVTSHADKVSASYVYKF